MGNLPSTPFYGQTPLYDYPHLCFFSKPQALDNIFFDYIAPMKYHKNKLMQQSYFFIFKSKA